MHAGVRDHLSKLAASRVRHWKSRIQHQTNVAERLLRKVAAKRASRRVPLRSSLAWIDRFDANRDLRGCRLHELEAPACEDVFDYGGQREGRYVHERAAGGAKGKHVIVPALDPDHRQWTAAAASDAIHRNAVAQVVTDDRLDVIGEIRQQDGV